MSDVTQILDAIKAGDLQAASNLLPLVYEELRKLAAVRMAAEKPGQTLQATALVHEAYVRLIGASSGEKSAEIHFDSRGHFFAVAAEAMRRILVESARRKGRVRHGGGRKRVNLDDAPDLGADRRDGDLLALDDALAALQVEDPAKAEIVKLRYFAGLTLEQTAAALGVSLATAKRRWAISRAWLYDRLSRDHPDL